MHLLDDGTSILKRVLALVTGYSRGSSGFGLLASAHMLCLPTNSVQVFQVGPNFQTLDEVQG